MYRRLGQQQKYFFPVKLKRQLAGIAHYPLTLVEAPSGFGKTTAVKHFLQCLIEKSDAREHWYTCLGESAGAAWMGICELFSNVDSKVATKMKNLKMPSLDTLFYLSLYLREINCQAETYLVIDNYQLVDSAIQWEMLSVFSFHGNPRLHLIFIAQQLDISRQITFHNDNIYTIGSAPFLFDKESTASLFRLEGIRLDGRELENIHKSSGGWISAIRLQIICCKEGDSFDYDADIRRLVEIAIWNKLTSPERHFFLSLSLLNCFTARQAAIMAGREKLPENFSNLLDYNEFIRFISHKQQYVMHSILRDYLLNRFESDLSENEQGVLFHKAGQAYKAISQYCKAADFFYRVKDFNAILSLPFSREYFENSKDIYEPGFFETLINECPKEALLRHPYTLLILGYQTFACVQYETYWKICKLLRLAMQKATGLAREELQNIEGEYYFLTSWKHYNDISKLKKGLQTSLETLNGPSGIIKNSAMWLYVTPSILNLFWREPGKLEETLLQFDELSIIYCNLTQKQGAGAKSVARAEALLMQGKDNEAEIFCHKALYDARNYEQISICLCAELILGKIAILRGDAEGYFHAIKNIKNYAKNNANLSILRLAEHCMSIISLLLGTEDHVATWLYDTGSINKMLFASAIPIAQVLHLELLLIKKRYNELFGISQVLMQSTFTNPDRDIQYLLPQIYLFIFLALAKRNNGKHLEAQNYLKKALSLALPDRAFLPFAQQYGIEGFLAELNLRFYDLTEPLDPSIPAKKLAGNAESNAFAPLLSLCKRQQKGVNIIRKAIFKEKSPLTPREREIALLARERFSAKEIAAKLYISVATVRTTLRNVYKKLDIHSRAELKLKEF